MFTIRYETAKYIVLCSLAVYAVLGILTNPYQVLGKRADSQEEVYPFFSWFLFAQIPNPSAAYIIRLVSYGDDRFSPPLPFEKVSFLFEAIGQHPTQYLPIIRSLGMSLEKGGKGALHRARIESIFKQPTEYQVVRVVRDPLEYWKTGRTEEERVLATFTSNGTHP